MQFVVQLGETFLRVYKVTALMVIICHPILFFVMSSILQFVSSCTFSSFTKSNFDIYSKLSKTHRSQYIYIYM